MKPVELLDPPYRTVINWLLVIAVIITMIFAGIQAHETSTLIEERGCISIKNGNTSTATGLNLPQYGVHPELDDPEHQDP